VASSLFPVHTLLKKLANEGVFAMQQAMKRPVEDEAAFFEHEKGGVGIGLALGEANHFVLLRIEAMGAEGKRVL